MEHRGNVLMALPLIQAIDSAVNQLQTKWKSQIDPALANPLLSGNLLTNITLKSGKNVVNHKLGRNLIGWFIVGVNGVANIYDTQASNQTPGLTLNLTSDAAVTVSLWVF
jgi:hypothetical protein